MIGGEGFVGCILEGPSLVLNGDAGSTKGVNVEWGPCPMTHNSCHEVDYCFNEPCMRHGTCVSRADRQDYECLCAPRFSGKNCDKDNETEANAGKTTREITNVSAKLDSLDAIARSKLLACLMNPCQNKGTCLTLPGGGQECQCAPGFTGHFCQEDINECLSNPCQNVTCVNVPLDLNLDECISSPCQHGGTCRDLIGSYECLCTSDFTGFNCERLVIDTTLSSVTAMDSDPCGGCPRTPPACTAGDTRSLPPSPCSSSPCAHGGACQDIGPYTFNCSCAPGYSGSQCELVNPASLHSTPGEISCYVRSCMNGGTCTGDPPQCVCPEKWTGAFCERQIRCSDAPWTAISASVCPVGLEQTVNSTGTIAFRNSVTMAPLVSMEQTISPVFVLLDSRLDSYFCECLPGWTGTNCELNRNDCVPEQCHNGATCVDGTNNFTCVCPPGFSGSLCQLSVDECLSNPCMNGGSCIDRVDGYSCNCTENFMGERCELPFNPCASSYEGLFCENNKNDCQGVMCQEDRVCVDLVNGYEGLFCENNKNDCQGVMCQEDRVCVDLVNGYECRCKPGYTGENCTVDIDHCEDQPCKNNGTCKDYVGNYTCHCPAGYTGKECGQNINECESNPCQNGSTCIDAIASFTCACPPGITGLFCEVNIDECECDGTGYEGPNCEHNIDDCAPQPCRNGGQCRDLVNDYACDCFPAYTGKNCETDIAECESQPCQYNGTCLELSDQKIYEDPTHPHRHLLPDQFNYENAAGFVCACVEGTIGSRCETNIDECESSPCMHGTCKDGIASY
ncbi:hypothetical protein B566_EDAN004144, partial [Ephemera danica]